MKKLLFLWVVLAALVSLPSEAEAQLFKKKDKPPKEKKKGKKKGGKKGQAQQYQGFNPGQALTPEQQKAQMVNPMRKILNQFNLSVEKGYGFFSYQNALTGVSVIRNPAGDMLSLAAGNVTPVQARPQFIAIGSMT